MSFKHLTANGSVDRGQPERATGGRGMANLVPTYPLEGKGARVACAPFRSSPGGPGNLQPGEKGSLWRERPSGGCWPWERELELAARLVHRCHPCSPLPGDPFVSRGAGSPPSHGVLLALLRPLASVCAFPRGHGLCGLLWQPPAFVGPAGSAPGWGATCWPGVGAGRGGGPRKESGARSGPGTALGARARVSGWRAVSPPPSPPPPSTVASLCAAGEGTERESYFSKLLSSSSLPCDSCGGREGCERLGPGDFPECGAVGASSGHPLPKAPPFPSSRACPHPHPTPAGPGSRLRAAQAQERHFGGRAARGRGTACKVAVSLPCSPQPPGRGRAHLGDPGLGPGGEWRGPASEARFPCRGSALTWRPRRQQLGRHVKCSNRGSRSRAPVEGG